MLHATRNEHDEIESTLIRALDLVRSQFLEMPGLPPTEPQTAKLFAMDAEVCALVLERLIETRFLVRTRDARLAPASEVDSGP